MKKKLLVIVAALGVVGLTPVGNRADANPAAAARALRVLAPRPAPGARPSGQPPSVTRYPNRGRPTAMYPGGLPTNPSEENQSSFEKALQEALSGPGSTETWARATLDKAQSVELLAKKMQDAEVDDDMARLRETHWFKGVAPTLAAAALMLYQENPSAENEGAFTFVAAYLWPQLRPVARSYLRGLGGNEVDADAAISAALQRLRNPAPHGRFDPARGTLTAFAARITQNEASRLMRPERNPRRAVLEDSMLDDVTVLDPSEMADIEKCLELVVRGYSASRAHVIKAYIEGEVMARVAPIVGISEGQASKYTKAFRKDMKQCLGLDVNI